MRMGGSGTVPNGTVYLLIRPLSQSLAQSGRSAHLTNEAALRLQRGVPVSSGAAISSCVFRLFPTSRPVRMLKASFPFFFSYIPVHEPVLPSPEVTNITRIARTAIALPTRLLDGQITGVRCRHKPVLNSLGTYCPHPPTAHQRFIMNWTSGWVRPPAGPEVNKQFTVPNQIFSLPISPAIIEIIYRSRRRCRPS